MGSGWAADGIADGMTDGIADGAADESAIAKKQFYSVSFVSLW